jgi:hypothetical protein
MAVTSGLNAIHIAPRTPKNVKGQWSGGDDVDTQEVELSLLDEDDRRQAAVGLGETEEQGYVGGHDVKHPMSTKDQRGMALLIILCEHDFVGRERCLNSAM